MLNDSSNASWSTHSNHTLRVWALLQALSCNFPASLISCKLALVLCRVPATGWVRKRAKPQKKKGPFVTSLFWTLLETETELCHRLVACDSDLGRWAFSKIQSTKKENGRKKNGCNQMEFRKLNIVLARIIKITGKHVAALLPAPVSGDRSDLVSVQKVCRMRKPVWNNNGIYYILLHANTLLNKWTVHLILHWSAAVSLVQSLQLLTVHINIKRWLGQEVKNTTCN